MEKVKVPERQLQAMLALFLADSSFISAGESKAQQDSWICLIVLSCASSSNISTTSA